MSLEERERSRCVGLKTELRGMSKSMKAASRGWKRQGDRFSPSRLQEEGNPNNILILVQLSPS